MGKIPDSVVINWNQTGTQYIPVSLWTMEKEGAKRVEITGLKDKRQITAMFTAAKDGYSTDNLSGKNCPQQQNFLVAANRLS